MLDNNQFFYTPNGWTCHCEGCQKRFRQYVRERFGDEDALRLFGARANALRIPVEKGPLFALWVHWRNRVWAEVNETFRARLRQADPKIMLFANTQYEWPDGLLASDLQYEHEDVLLSESRGLSGRHMSDKMVVGQALAGGRPLWNYIGTFEESDFTRLRPQAVVGPIIAASLAHGARPWIVYYGFHDEQGEYRARGEMSSLLSWYAANPALFSGRRWASAGVLLSISSRNALGKPLMPLHLARLLQANVPLIALRDDRLTARALKPLKIVTADPSACLSPEAVRLLAAWVRAGGSLVAIPDAGRFDELGRPRNRSTLEAALNVTLRAGDEISVGKGRVRCAEPEDFAGVALDWSRADRFALSPQAPVEVVPYRTPGRLLLHLIRHEPASGPVALALPGSLNIGPGQAEWHTPGFGRPQALIVEKAEGRAVVRLPELPVYSVISIPAL